LSIEQLVAQYLTAIMPRLTDLVNRVCFRTMEGLFFEKDSSDLKLRLLFGDRSYANE